jgi:hypothetical protein
MDRPAQDFWHTTDVSARSSQPAFQQVAGPSLTESTCVRTVSNFCTPPHVTRRLLSDAPFERNGDEASVVERKTAGISAHRKNCATGAARASPLPVGAHGAPDGEMGPSSNSSCRGRHELARDGRAIERDIAHRNLRARAALLPGS